MKLVGLANLKKQLEANSSSDKAFEINWSVVGNWAVEDRYNLDVSPTDAKELYRAICARRNGVMAWIRRHW